MVKRRELHSLEPRLLLLIARLAILVRPSSSTQDPDWASLASQIFEQCSVQVDTDDWQAVARAFRTPIYRVEGPSSKECFLYHLLSMTAELAPRVTKTRQQLHRVLDIMSPLLRTASIPSLPDDAWVSLVSRYHAIDSEYDAFGFEFLAEVIVRNLGQDSASPAQLKLFCYYMPSFTETKVDDRYVRLTLKLLDHADVGVRLAAASAISRLRGPVEAQLDQRYCANTNISRIVALYDPAFDSRTARRLLVAVLGLTRMRTSVPADQLEVALFQVVSWPQQHPGLADLVFSSLPGMWRTLERFTPNEATARLPSLHSELLSRLGALWTVLQTPELEAAFSCCLVGLARFRNSAHPLVLSISEARLAECLATTTWLETHKDVLDLVAVLADQLPQTLVDQALVQFCETLDFLPNKSRTLGKWLSGMIEILRNPLLVGCVDRLPTARCWDLPALHHPMGSKLLLLVTRFTSDPDFLVAGLEAASRHDPEAVSVHYHDALFLLLSRGYRLPPDFDLTNLMGRYLEHPHILRPLLYARPMVSLPKA